MYKNSFQIADFFHADIRVFYNFFDFFINCRALILMQFFVRFFELGFLKNFHKLFLKLKFFGRLIFRNNDFCNKIHRQIRIFQRIFADFRPKIYLIVCRAKICFAFRRRRIKKIFVNLHAEILHFYHLTQILSQKFFSANKKSQRPIIEGIFFKIEIF